MHKIVHCSLLFPAITIIVFIVIITGCEGQRVANVEKLKTNIRRVLDETWNKGNLEVLDELYATDIVRHLSPFPDLKGIEAYRERIKGIRDIYPDHLMKIDEIIVKGNTVAVRFTWQGTHTGQSLTIPSISPTGKQVRVTGCYILHLLNNKVIEEWIYEDMLGLREQLGYKLVPPEKQDEI